MLPDDHLQQDDPHDQTGAGSRVRAPRLPRCCVTFAFGGWRRGSAPFKTLALLTA